MSLLAEWLSASQEGLRSMELVRVRVTLQLTVSQSVLIGNWTPLGLMTIVWL